jgi:hypothetical protein
MRNVCVVHLCGEKMGDLVASKSSMTKKHKLNVVGQRMNPFLMPTEWKELSSFDGCNLVFVWLAHIYQAKYITTVELGMNFLCRKSCKGHFL